MVAQAPLLAGVGGGSPADAFEVGAGSELRRPIDVAGEEPEAGTPRRQEDHVSRTRMAFGGGDGRGHRVAALDRQWTAFRSGFQGAGDLIRLRAHQNDRLHIAGGNRCCQRREI